MKIKLLLAFLLAYGISFSQFDPTESLIYSRAGGLSGTARSIGAGGAFGSVGADLGCIEINPAGLGLYRSTDFSVTPGLQIGSAESTYNNSSNNKILPKPYFGQAGVEWTKILKKSSKTNSLDYSERPLRSFTFAINFQQQSFFARSQVYSANNTGHSLIDLFARDWNAVGGNVNYLSPEMYIAGPNYGNLVGYNPATQSYVSNFKAPVAQAGDIETRGSVDNIDLAFGGNFGDKVYFGFGIGVPILSYNVNYIYSESETGNAAYSDYNYNSYLNTSGVGVTGSLGLIYRPLPWLRFGAAYHLPTWYSLIEGYSTTLNVDSGAYTTTIGPAQIQDTRYGMRTPMKGSFGASFYYKEIGFLSVDYDIQNFGATRYHFPNDSTALGDSLNVGTGGIKQIYGFTHTLHVGIEAAVKVVRFRAGYYFSSTPFKKNQEVTPGYMEVRNAFTVGIGVRLKHFYVDLAYVYGWSKDASTPFYGDPVNVYNTTHNLLLTLGWKLSSEPGSNKASQRRQQPSYTPPPVDDDRRF